MFGNNKNDTLSIDIERNNRSSINSRPGLDGGTGIGSGSDSERPLGLDEHEGLNEDELFNKDEEWKEYHENILVDWADKALCYRWLHSRSCSKYVRLRNLYTIPVIILSTLTGTANFAIARIPPEYQAYSQVAIGSLNIIAGIITTISQFLNINELSEAHRVASISWDKFYRNIRVELVKAPEDRTAVSYIIKNSKDEYDRLIETSPRIDNNIVKKFNKVFKFNNKLDNNKKTEAIKLLNKPEILDSLESTRTIVYKKSPQDTNNLSQKTKKEQQDKENLIENFVDTFQKEYTRKPSILEIQDNLENKVQLSDINKFLSSKNWTNKK